MSAEIDVGKQVGFALLGGLDGFGVAKQVGYAILAYPHIDAIKQVGYGELVNPGVQIGKQVAYGLLKTYPPVGFAVDLTGELTLQATFTDPSARFAVDFVGEGQLGLGLTRVPPFDCETQETTAWSVAVTTATTWNNASTQAAQWACVDDAADLHDSVLIDLAGAFLVTKNAKRIKLIRPPKGQGASPPPVVPPPPPPPAPPPPPPPSSGSLSQAAFTGTVRTVSPDTAGYSQLIQALIASNPGDVVELNAGTYPDLSWYGGPGAKAAPGVLVRPVAAASVTMTSLSLDGWNGFTFGPHGATRLQIGTASVSNGDRMVLDSIDFPGDPANASTTTTNAINYRNVTNFTVNNCTAQYYAGCLVGIGAAGFTCSNNTFQHTNDDIVHLGADLSNFVFQGNLLTLSNSPGLLHADALQIFGATGSTLSNLQILDNKIIRGVGGAPVQGIFLQAEGISASGLTVRGNMIMTGNYWGIGVSGPWADVTLDTNYIGGFTDALNGSTVMTPWIRFADCSTITISNNAVYGGNIIDYGGNTGVVLSGNTTIASLAAPDDLTAANAWWAANH